MRARSLLAGAAAGTLFILAACGGTSGGGNGGVDRNKGSKGNLTVVGQGFTESDVVANLYADVLSKAGYKTTVTKVSNTELVQKSLQNGQVAVAPEYAATYADELNTSINGPKAASVASPDLQTTLKALKTLANKVGLTPLDPSKAVDQNAFAVSTKFAKQHSLKTLSDLGRSKVPVILAAAAECKIRPFCQPGLEKTYGIKVTKIDPLGVDTTATKNTVAKGVDQLALVLTTDATVPDAGLVTLTDDKHLQNADYLIPIVNTKKLTPDIEKALNGLSAVLTTADLAQMNKQVDVGQMTAADVASAYLKTKGLL